jgi:hypothetical protein
MSVEAKNEANKIYEAKRATRSGRLVSMQYRITDELGRGGESTVH